MQFGEIQQQEMCTSTGGSAQQDWIAGTISLYTLLAYLFAPNTIHISNK